MPFRSSAENATVAATELINALQNPTPAAPFAHIGDKQMEALQQLATIFKQATSRPLPVHEHPVPAPRVGKSPQSAKLPQSTIKTHPAALPRVEIIKQSTENPHSDTQ